MNWLRDALSFNGNLLGIEWNTWKLIGMLGKVRAETSPRRRVEGFACTRSEVSGRRLWGWARDRFGAPANFFSRFFVQWYATEKKRQVVIPVAFWWLSLIGSSLLLAYALFYRRDSVFTLAYAFTWIPYIRNLIIHQRYQSATVTCTACQTACNHPEARFCPICASPLTVPVDGEKKSGKK